MMLQQSELVFGGLVGILKKYCVLSSFFNILSALLIFFYLYLTSKFLSFLF